MDSFTDFTCRSLVEADFYDYCTLMASLVTNHAVPRDSRGEALFSALLKVQGTHVFGADLDGQIISTATLHILPNLTYDGRPYGFIENVVTLSEYRERGVGRAVMQHVIDFANAASAYKLQLLTGQDYGARGFYEKLGFNANDKYGMTLRHVPTRPPAA